MNRHQRREAKAQRRAKRISNRRRTSDIRRATRYTAQHEGRDRLLELGRTGKVPADVVPSAAPTRKRYKSRDARDAARIQREKDRAVA